MSNRKFSLDRRDAFKLTAGMGLALGIGKIASVREGLLFQHLLGGASLGSLDDVAFAAAAGAGKRCLVHIVIIDKTQTALFQHIAGGTPPPGADAAAGIAQARSTFRDMGLTQLFGDALQSNGLPTNVALSFNTAWQSGSGGHSLANSYIDDELGGINSGFEKLSGGTGILGAVGFNMNASANQSREAFLGPGKRQLTTFETVKDLTDTLQSSVVPLQDKKSLEMVKFMDSLVTPKFEMRDRLVTLANKIGGSIPQLRAAQAVKWTNPLAPMMGNNNMPTSVDDGVMQQVRAVIALYNAGVARNFMIAVPWNDTNGGNSLTNAGGELRLDPFSATPKIAEALAELHKGIRDLVTVTTSDGGRSANNGDQSAGLAMMTGPDTVVKGGVIGGTYETVDQVNQPRGTVTFSDSSKGVSTPADWYRTALVALGHKPSDGKYVKEALV